VKMASLIRVLNRHVGDRRVIVMGHKQCRRQLPRGHAAGRRRRAGSAAVATWQPIW
jgi:hypothetical protein